MLGGGSAQAQAQAYGLLSVLDYGALGDGLADDLPAFQAALAAAQSTRATGVYAPAGTYRFANTTGGRPLEMTAAGKAIVGDGPALTTIKLDDNLALTSHMRLIYISGARCAVRGLSIQFGNGTAGIFDQSAVEITTGALRWHVSDLDISGVWGAGSAGGSGVGCYQDATVGGGQQFGLCERVVVHDSPRCSAFGINSNNNTIRECQAVRIGSTTQQHGYYCVGGFNLYQQCYAELCSGMSFHAHKQNSTADGSGDIYDGCVSVSPGLKHMVVNPLTSNPALTRYVTIRNCTFRGPAEGVEVKCQALIEGNTFEGVVKPSQSAIVINVGAQGSIVRGNMLLNSAPITLNAAATAEGNNLMGSGILLTAPGAVARGNRITIAGIAGALGILANAANVRVTENDITITAPGTCIKATSAATGLIAKGNVLTSISGAWYHDIPQTLAGVVLENVLR